MTKTSILCGGFSALDFRSNQQSWPNIDTSKTPSIKYTTYSYHIVLDLKSGPRAGIFLIGSNKLRAAFMETESGLMFIFKASFLSYALVKKNYILNQIVIA